MDQINALQKRKSSYEPGGHVQRLLQARSAYRHIRERDEERQTGFTYGSALVTVCWAHGKRRRAFVRLATSASERRVGHILKSSLQRPARVVEAIYTWKGDTSRHRYRSQRKECETILHLHSGKTGIKPPASDVGLREVFAGSAFN